MSIKVKCVTLVIEEQFNSYFYIKNFFYILF